MVPTLPQKAGHPSSGCPAAAGLLQFSSRPGIHCWMPGLFRFLTYQGVTVKVSALVVPAGVVTVTLRAVVPAVVVIVQLEVAEAPPVATTGAVHVTPVPDTCTAVAPVRLVPFSVIVNAVPLVREPLVGLIDVSVAPPTVKVSALVVPAGVVTVTLRAVSPAVVVIVQLEVAEAPPVATTGAVHVTPVPDTCTAVAPVRLVPFSVIVNVAPRRPLVGLIDVSVAPCTVKPPVETALPPGVATVTLRAVSAAVVVIVKVAVTCVLLTATKLLTVTPAPDTVTPVAPVRFVPLIVTGTAVPRTPVAGAIEVMVGPVAVKPPVRT